MKKLLFLVICLSPLTHAADNYLKIGTGYKLQETEKIYDNEGGISYLETGGPISARIELGRESGNWTYGISHHSQWFAGWPCNDDDEVQKTELFIDYKFSF